MAWLKIGKGFRLHAIKRRYGIIGVALCGISGEVSEGGSAPRCKECERRRRISDELEGERP